MGVTAIAGLAATLTAPVISERRRDKRNALQKIADDARAAERAGRELSNDQRERVSST
jgi:hypothetical protein